MTRNGKIALGCGGGGCLGLIVLGVIGAAIYFFYMSKPAYRNYNVNYNSNYNLNTNSNTNGNRNTNGNSNTNTNSSSSNSSTSSMSDDDKHKLWQAASATGDQELVRRVSVKLGILNDDFTPGENYGQFIAAHIPWVIANRDFVQEVSTPEKARAYVNEHM